MCMTANFKDKKFLKIMNNIITLSKKYNIACGDHVVDPDRKLLESRINQGYRFLAFSTDGVFLNRSSVNPIK